jgi:protein subunit release factor A
VTLDPRDVQVELWRDAAPVHVTQAVRLTHKPTGIVVECREHASQIANRDAAAEELERRVAEATAALDTAKRGAIRHPAARPDIEGKEARA